MNLILEPHRLTKIQAQVAHALALLHGHEWAKYLTVDEVIGKTQGEIADMTLARHPAGKPCVYQAPYIQNDMVNYLNRPYEAGWIVYSNGSVDITVERRNEDVIIASLPIGPTQSHFAENWNYIATNEPVGYNALPQHIHLVIQCLQVLVDILPSAESYIKWLESRIPNATALENIELSEQLKTIPTQTNAQVLACISILASRLKDEEDGKPTDIAAIRTNLINLIDPGI